MQEIENLFKASCHYVFAKTMKMTAFTHHFSDHVLFYLTYFLYCKSTLAACWHNITLGHVNILPLHNYFMHVVFSFGKMFSFEQMPR